MELYRARDISVYEAGNGQVLVHLKDEGVISKIPAAIAALLLHCNSFRPLEKHVESYSKKFQFSRKNQSAVAENLKQLAEGGFLVSKTEFLKRCDGHPSASVPPLHALGILTRNRPAMLERAVKSFTQNALTFSRTLDVTVMDNSENPSIRTQNREILATLNGELGASLFYAGAEEKRTFIDQLSKASSVSSDIIQFALSDFFATGYAPGSNRNALLLDHAGQMFLSTDDDVMPQVAPIPSGSPDLHFFSGKNPMSYWYYKNQDDLKNSVSFIDPDVFAIHEKLLGKHLSQAVVEESSERVHVENLDAGLLAALEAGRGKIAATIPGIAGDSGAAFPTGSIFPPDTSRSRILVDERFFWEATSSRLILKGVPMTTLSDSAYCMTTILGLDHRTILPPFLPIYRGEDALFSFLMRRCFSDSYLGYLPWAFLHAPEKLRSHERTDLRKGATALHVYKIVQFCLMDCFTGDRSPFNNDLRAPADHVIRLSELSPADFQNYLQHRLWEEAQERIKGAEALLREHGEAPGYWAKEVRGYIEAVSEAMAQEDYGISYELPQTLRSKEAAFKFYQDVLGKFGQLLQMWPALFQAAQDLRRKDIRIAQKIR